MSTVIHQILVKKLNETSEVLLTIDFWSNRQMRSYIGSTVHLYEIVSNYEITNKRIFSVAGRIFKPDRCRFTDKRFEALMFTNCKKDFNY